MKCISCGEEAEYEGLYNHNLWCLKCAAGSQGFKLVKSI